MPTKERRVPFTILPLADKLHGCDRCRRKLRRGEHAVSIVRPGLVSYRHAGRACPPLVIDRHPFLR